MAGDLRPLGPKDLDDLKVDPDGKLYWKGKEVRTGGWTRAERSGLIAAAVSVLALLVNVLKDYPGIKEGWGGLTGAGSKLPAPGATPAQVQPAQGKAGADPPVSTPKTASP